MLDYSREAGIPIDMVGGVSIGAFMGALWCMEKNVTTMTQKAREWSKSDNYCPHVVGNRVTTIVPMWSVTKRQLLSPCGR
uniref:PNPLA domain-containing protein n=1 Tax=Timema tahoe TaxID=61484 RepID=A0A7R9ILU0_9NEOP|nr:unnamed protein product [Timema tahoe]